VDQYRGTDRMASATESAHTDQANRAELRGLISTGSQLEVYVSLACAEPYSLTLHGDRLPNVTATVTN